MPTSSDKITVDLDHQRQKFRIKLLEQFILVGLVSAFFQLVVDFYDDSALSINTELSFTVILAILFILNKKGYYKIARIATIIIVNAALFFAYKFEPNGGIQYYYFPMVLLAVVLYDTEDWIKTILFGLLPIFLFILNTNEHFQGNINLQDKNLVSTIINFSASVLITSIAIIYLIKSNVEGQHSLIEANEELSTVSNELKINNQILAKTNDELDKFMYSSSHDLRAPLASILGLVNLAKLEPPEKHSDYIEMIRDRVIGLDYFIKDIIDFSKNSNTSIRYEMIDVKELIDLCFEHNQYLPGAEAVDISVSIDIFRIKSDHYRLSSILTTLIANAVQYHNPNQDKPMIWIEVNGSNPVEFIVRDNGNGISKKVRPHIFDMFYRGNEKSNGSGLGLYIAREMLNSLRGTFEVISEEGKGAIFKFYLPVPK
jgi:signal transduction histidine kinase